MVQNVILVFFRRRLSQRPAVEELESRNILKREWFNPTHTDSETDSQTDSFLSLKPKMMWIICDDNPALFPVCDTWQ